MEAQVSHIARLGTTRERFTYDLRGGCVVYSGSVAAYRDSERFPELPAAIAHALANDAIIGACKDEDGKIRYASCRLFTDQGSALRFAREQGQRCVYNLNRNVEVLTGTGTLAINRALA